MNESESSPVFVIGSYVAAITMRVDRIPAPGESVRGSEVLLEAGGKGLNVAVGLRRLGLEVTGLIAIGSDAFAAMAGAALRHAGLSETMLIAMPGASGTGVGLIDRDGANLIAVDPGANCRLAAEHVLAVAADVRNAGAVVAQFEVDDAPIAAAFAVAQEVGGQTILNPSPYRPIAPEILSRTSLIVVNRIEAAALAAQLGCVADEADDFAALYAALPAHGPEALVVTLGEAGSVAWRAGSGPIRQAAFPIVAQDSTGCGDAFLAGLVGRLSAGADWPEALRFAAACGAIVCARGGVLAALPDAGQVAEITREGAALLR